MLYRQRKALLPVNALKTMLHHFKRLEWKPKQMVAR
jgi:hypothetical protein